MFRPKRLWLLCKASDSKNELTPSDRSKIFKKDRPSVAHYHNESDEYAVVEYKKAIYIIIAGSNDWKDWIRNFFWIRTFKYFGTSIGFGKATERICDEVIDNYHETLAKKRVYVIGHSRGGAIALILTTVLTHMGYDVEGCGFGVPKVGGKRFKRWFDELMVRFTRHEIEGDVVTRMPFLRGKYVGALVQYPMMDDDDLINNHLMYGEAIDRDNKLSQDS